MTSSDLQIEPPRKTGPPTGRSLADLPAASLIRAVYGACTLLLTALWAFIAADLIHERDLHVSQAERDTENLAIAFEHHVESTITSIDALLLSLRHELLEGVELGRHNDLVDWAHRGPLKQSVVQFGYIDRDGYLVRTSANQPAKPIYVGDREHFSIHANGKADQLFVGDTLRARTTDLDLIPFSRRLTGPDGSFRGVVSVLVRAEHFSRFYESLRLGSEGAVTLVRNGKVLARASASPPPGNPVGSDVSAVLPESAVRAATRIVVSPIDGLKRLIHYRRLEAHPLAVIVSLTERDYLADFRESRTVFLAIGGLASSAIVAFALLLIQFARRLESTRLRIAASETRYRSLFATAPMAYQSLDADGRIAEVNAAWETLFGIAAADAVGRPASDFLGANARTLLCCREPAGPPAGVAPESRHFNIWRPDGSQRLVVLAGCTQSVAADGSRGSQCMLRDVTDEHAQAAALSASEARMRGIVENINVATWEVDLATWRFTYVSPQVETMFGYPAADWLEEGFWQDHLHPEDRDSAISFCMTRTGRLEDHVFEYRFVKRDGHLAWIRDIVKVIADSERRPIRLTGVLIDVSAEKESAAELARQHALLRGLIDSVPDLIFFKDLDSVYLGCNRAFAEFAGRPESAQIGHTDFDFFDHDTAEFFRARDRDMLESGESRRNEEWVRYPDGREVLLDTLKAPFLDAGGKPLGLIGISRDITEGRRAADSLLLAQSVFESTREGILVTDASARILSVNPAFTTITGWSAGEVIGSRPSLLKSGRHPPEFYAEFWKALETTGHWSGEIWNRRKDGALYVEWMTVSAIRNARGRVDRYVALFSDITLRKSQEEKIWHQANFDALTGLANRNLFQDRLDRAIARGRRNGQRVGLMFIDLDRFKWINDTLGHEAGDCLLVEAAARLQACVREEDTVARLGGDEFTIVLQGLSDHEPLQAVAEKVLAALARPFLLGNTEQHVSGSVGVTLFPDDADKVGDLLRNADIAMYQAKAAGRNRYQFYSHDMQADALARVEVERDLRAAVESGGFVLYYQPIVDADSRELVGAEALLRWPHPTRGLLVPGDFLAVAEDCGLTVAIGEWVIDAVCRQWRRWADEGVNPVRLAINISNLHFRHPGLHDCLASALQRHAVPGDMLSLELTEALMLGQGEALTSRLLDLDGLGLHFSLDDFGTGYSSLTALKCFPFDTVKIDRSFVSHLPANVDDQHLVEAIAFMAHSLNLEVVAEGVESEAQLDFLREIGCDFVQGFMIGEPTSAEQFAARFGAQPAAGALPIDEGRFFAALRAERIDVSMWIRRLVAERTPQWVARLDNDGARIGSLDVVATIAAHLHWRARIESAIRDDQADTVTTEEAASVHDCSLGRWIDAHRTLPMAALASFERLRVVHREFHRVAASILADLKLGRRSEARRRVRGMVFRTVSHEVVITLIDLFVEEQARDPQDIG